jgi:hypothetical protein
MNSSYVPTSKLRWVRRPLSVSEGGGAVSIDAMLDSRVLQQWWAPNLPGYMADQSIGEWRDVQDGTEYP